MFWRLASDNWASPELPTLLEEAIYVCTKYLSVRDIVLPDPKANSIVLLFQIYTTILTR